MTPSPRPSPRPASSPPSSAPSSSSTTASAKTKKKAADAQSVADAFARGEVTLGAALGVTPAQKDVMRQRAHALLVEQKLKLAEPLLEGLVALDPFDAWTLTALGGLKLDTGDVALARKLLDRAVDVNPADVTARALRAEALALQGEVTKAREDLARLASADATLPVMHRARALGKAIESLSDGVALAAKAPASSSSSSSSAATPVRKSRAKLPGR
jgi:predicted Zn-dependent protease